MRKILGFLDKNKWLLVGFFCLFLVILTNQVHFSYPDEFESILGGRFILEGRLPYSGFFTHHNPFAYFISALAVLIGGVSFVHYRLVFGVFYLLGYIALFLFVRKQWPGLETKIVKWLIVFLVFSSTYTWGHMVLGDTLSAYFLLASYIIVTFSALRKTKITWKTIILVSILNSFAVLSSAAVAIAAGIIYLFLFYLFVKQEGFKIKKVLLFLVVIAAPYLMFVIYLLISGSFVEFYRQTIQYTTEIYAKLPGGIKLKNPVRILIVYLNEFIRNYRSIFLLIKDLNFANPFAQTLALSSFALIVYLALNKKFDIAVFVFLTLVYASVRGNPYSTTETDYQAIQYQFISMFNGLTAIIYLWNSLAVKKNVLPKKLLESFLFLFLSIYMFFLFWLFMDKWWEKTYLKYMGQQSLIYDRPSIASMLNDLIPPAEYYFIAPFDFENQMYMKSKPASKYIVVLGGMDESSRIKDEIIKDLSATKPRIVVFNTEFRFFNGSRPPGEFVMNFVNQNYLNLESLGLSNQGYSFKYKRMGDYDFERHFFILKEKEQEVLKDMLDKGYLIPPQKVPSL